jgi:hypothetical protein
MCLEANSITSSNINVFYRNLLESLTNTDSTRFDKQYAIALQAEITTRGVLATAKYLCTFCLKQMKRTNKRKQSTSNDDDPTTISQANSLYAIPKESILNGHFAGAIPDELLNLTDIEKTMISIYSPVTKYSLCTKEHFRINGATTYTIVNDLFTIAKGQIELENKLSEVEKENSIKQNKIILLEEENKRINELYNNLLDKCIKNNNSNNIITNNNNTNTVNNNNNTINITLTNFGYEKYTKLTNEEQIRILKSNKQCVSNLIKFLHINDRLPEYKNICVKNLRGKGGYLYEGNKWLHCNFENLLIILFKNKINDLEKILNNNEGLINFNNNYIQNLIENYTDDMDSFIKNNKDNIINMLYNNTKNYKI